MRLILVILALAAAARADVELIYRLEGPEQERDVAPAVVDVVRKRIAAAALAGVTVKRSGKYSFVVRVPSGPVEDVKRLVAARGTLEFRITVENGDPGWETCAKAFHAAKDKRAARSAKRGFRWHVADKSLAKRALVDDTGRCWMLVRIDKHNVTRDALENVAARLNTEGLARDYAIVADVKKAYQPRMEALTAHPGTYMAVILDGRIGVAPILQDKLSNSIRITGGYTEEQARMLAAILRNDPLPLKPVFVAARTAKR
ncbi:MAG: SecDF P1 head subdomain-containing protein [Planctomycetota bacterium]